jgi:hypothetical protein
MVNNLANTYTVAAAGKVWIDLIKKTDTTYTKLEYENTPVWDILKYIAESADKAGVIGYDFRVAPDGKFEFFPKNSKTSPVTLGEKIEYSEYRKDIHRIRNKIMVYGLADKSVPADKDAWTESLTPSDGVWSAVSGETSFDTTNKVKGTGSVKTYAINLYYAACMFTLNAGKEVNSNLYPILSFYSYLEKSYNGNARVTLYDVSDKQAIKEITIGPDEWRKTDLKVGLANEVEWGYVQPGFDWSKIKKFRIDCDFSGVGTGSFWLDMLYFGGRRYEAVREDSASQTNYGLRELSETDEELVSDNECDLRAKALLDYFKAPAEYLSVRSTVIYYGNAPLLAGDQIWVSLPNENVNAYFRIESVEYHVDAKSQTLEIGLELGKVPPLLADYLYGMRATTVTVEKLARTKLGKKGIPSIVYGGGIGAHHKGHEAGGDDGVQWASEDDGGWDKITGWVCPKHIGPFDDQAAPIKFRTKNKAGNAALNHRLEPSDAGYGWLGSESLYWEKACAAYFLLPTDGYVCIRAEGQQPHVQLTKDTLAFGPGGISVTDAELKRVGAGQLQFRDDLLPVADNSGNLGNDTKRIYRIRANNIVGNNITATEKADVLLLWVGGSQVITSGRVLQNIAGINTDLVPTVDNALNLGTDDYRMYRVRTNNLVSNSLSVIGQGDLGSISIGGTVIVTTARVLQNVTADAAIITSGVFDVARIPNLDASKITSGNFPLARLPQGANRYFLMGKGVGYDTVFDLVYWSDIQEKPSTYPPSGHTHDAADIASGTIPEVRLAHTWTSTFYPTQIGDSASKVSDIWVVTLHQGDALFQNNFRITEAEKLGFKKGLAFLNPKGKVIMLIDGNGNVEIFGELKQQSSKQKSLWRKMKQNAKKAVIKP